MTFSVILLFIGINSFWIANNFYSSEKFADNITSVLNEEEVRLAIGDQVSAKLYEDNPVASRILSEPTQSVVASLLKSDQFQQIFKQLAQSMNAYILKGDQQVVTIDLTGILSIIQDVADRINPEGEQVIEAGELEIVILEPGDVPNLRALGIASLLVGPYVLLSLLIIFVVAWRKIESKRELVRLTGLVFIFSSVAVLIVAWTEAVLLNSVITTTNGDIVVGAIYDSFTKNLYTLAYFVMTSGLALVFGPKLYSWIKSRN